jgi:hypothetical protein
MERRYCISLLTLGLAGCGPKFVTVEQKETEPRTIHVARPAVTPQPVEDASSPAADEKGYAEVQWNVLRGLNTRTGEPSPLLEVIAGTNVKIAGYMVPLDDGFQEANEFLLVPTAGACIHTPPPPGNQIVYATMSTGRPAKVELIYPVWVYGKLEIMSVESPYGPAGFRMGVVNLKRRG